QVFQAVVPRGCWFGAELAQNRGFSQNRGEVVHPSYALVGCTVAPGFEFEDFEMARRELLPGQYPGQDEVIQKLRRMQRCTRPFCSGSFSRARAPHLPSKCDLPRTPLCSREAPDGDGLGGNWKSKSRTTSSRPNDSDCCHGRSGSPRF